MQMRGDVTTFASVAGFAPDELERRIGYRYRRLSQGYEVYELRQAVKVDDFVWRDETRYSGGWQHLEDEGEDAQRIDLLRWDLYKQQNYNDANGEKELKAFLDRETEKLNVRVGPDRIVKLRPLIGHGAAKWWIQYPNAPVARVPQWTILKGREKAFVKIASVPPGGVLPR
jgi:hypothetical protein